MKRRQLKVLIENYSDLRSAPTLNRLNAYIDVQQAIVANLDEYTLKYSSFLTWIIMGFTVLLVLTGYTFVAQIRRARFGDYSFLGIFIVVGLAVLSYILVPMVMVADELRASLTFVYPNRTLWKAEEDNVPEVIEPVL